MASAPLSVWLTDWLYLDWSAGDYSIQLFALMAAYVIGVGVTKFEKPQTRNWDYPDMGREAGTYNFLSLLVVT